MERAKVSQTTERVYSHLKKDILEGHYRPSEKLVEADLATRYDTSRNTIKNVLLMLAQDNLITHEPYKGAKVKAFSLEQLIDLLAVREAIERLIAADVARHITPTELHKLENCLQGMREAATNDDYTAYSACNNAFHAVLYSACRNKAAAELVAQIKNQFSKYNLKIAVIEGRRTNSIHEHSAIYEAMRQGDEAAAQNAISNHLHGITKALRENSILLF